MNRSFRKDSIPLHSLYIISPIFLFQRMRQWPRRTFVVFGLTTYVWCYRHALGLLSGNRAREQIYKTILSLQLLVNLGLKECRLSFNFSVGFGATLVTLAQESRICLNLSMLLTLLPHIHSLLLRLVQASHNLLLKCIILEIFVTFCNAFVSIISYRRFFA